MKKVLIWDISFKLDNVGGPAGYLYNLHEYLKCHPNLSITFLSDLLGVSEFSEQSYVKKRKSWKSFLLNFRFVQELNFIIALCWKEYRHTNVSLPSNIDLNEYDFIHFHQVVDVVRHSSLLKNFRGKTILTNHCPCTRVDEILALKPKWYKIFRPFMLRQELKCYDAADYIMFPCEDACEPYIKDRRVKKLFESCSQKFFYVPSAIMDLSVDTTKMQKFSEFGIPDDSFVITYFGRHNEIKGYDILKKIGEVLLPKCENLYFLCAGRGPIEPLKHPRWIELGFIKNTHELLYQSDLYVIPNRETYFDLVVLEILRSATMVLLSNTGGNKYFKQLPANETEGIDFFDNADVDSVIKKIQTLILNKKENVILFKNRAEKNRMLWKEYFTLETYVDRYVKSINQL